LNTANLPLNHRAVDTRLHEFEYLMTRADTAKAWMNAEIDPLARAYWARSLADTLEEMEYQGFFTLPVSTGVQVALDHPRRAA